MLLNFDGKTFLLKLQLHEELCRRSVVGKGLLPGPNFWLRAVSHLCLSLCLLSSVKLSVGLQSPGLSHSRGSGRWKAMRYRDAYSEKNASGLIITTYVRMETQVMFASFGFTETCLGLLKLCCIICTDCVWPKPAAKLWEIRMLGNVFF